MLESLEGKRGEIRPRPPLPAIKGLFGQPDHCQQRDLAGERADHPRQGRAFYRDFGVGRSRGTLAIQLGGNIKRGGLIEKAFGLTLRELLVRLRRRQRVGPADPGRSGRRSAGRISCPSRNSTRRSTTRRSPTSARWSAMAASSCSTTPSTWPQMARYAMEFCAIESCGKCTPCRIGSTRGVEVIDRVLSRAPIAS